MQNFKKYNQTAIINFPPYKNGRTMLEYFYDYYENNNHKNNKNKSCYYISVLWNTFDKSIKNNNDSLQNLLCRLPKNKIYFTVDNADTKINFTFPENTIVFSCCGEDKYTIALLYEDITNKLPTIATHNQNPKKYLASFVGGLSHHTRNKICDVLNDKKNIFIDILPEKEKKEATNKNLEKYSQNKFRYVIENYYPEERVDNFLKTTLESYFCIAPRGIGRQSYRFYEAMQLGVIPVYIWDDIEVLPYKELINYNEFCISININDIDKLYDMMTNIVESGKYLDMQNKMKNMQKYFTLDFMCEYILKKMQT
jgi:hypothetical protein